MHLCGIVFYHPKNPQNLGDMAALASHKRVPLVVVQRPGEQVRPALPPRARVITVQDIREVGNVFKEALYLVLETYGLRFIEEIELQEGNQGCLVLVVGAEDYGIPEEEAARLPGERIVAKIPVAVQGMSYNVVVSAAIALYVIEAKIGEPREGTRGTGAAQ